MIFRKFCRVFLFLFCCGQVVGLAQTVCSAIDIQPKGNDIEKQFFAMPAARVRDAASDAMLATGVALFQDGDQAIYGERSRLLTQSMDLPKGDEAVKATIQESTKDGIHGTELQVETSRPGGKRGAPKQSWSGTILEVATCLLTQLSVEDPHKNPRGGQPLPAGANLKEVDLPDGTTVGLYLRRPLRADALRIGQRVDLEVAADVLIDGQVVIRKGALAGARIAPAAEFHPGMPQLKDIGGTIKMEFATAIDGQRLPLSVESAWGKEATWKVKRERWIPYRDLQLLLHSILAGTPVTASVDKAQRIHVNLIQ